MAESSTITREGATSSAEHSWPSPDRAFWETAREIPHIEAREAARRLVNSHFRNPDSARVSIPANPEQDDDLVLHSYIRQQARKADDAITAGIQAGLEAAIRGIDATILNLGGECSRRGIQDPETGEVPCDGEDDRGCACSEALELGDRLIKNLRSADVAKIAALATGGA